MVTRGTDSPHSLEEAAGWFTQLKQSPVSEDTIDAFFEWRRAPANEKAYAEVEARWRDADRVRNDPELVARTEAILRRRTVGARLRGRLRSHWPLFGLAAAAIAGAAYVGLTEFGPHIYRTAVGAQQIVQLEDGSLLRLNTDSKVAVRYSRRVRRLTLLRGEAFFEVAHNPARPFVVEAGPARVRAVGTKFDVRRDGRATQVTLVEGQVQVSRPSHAERWTLTPDQQITVDGVATAPEPTLAADATSWTTGRLRFRETPLATAVDEVNRYSRAKIVLDDARVQSVRVNGVFDTGDSRAFLSAVTALFDLEAVPDRGGTILRARTPSSPS
jgi:transmembrane sensor